MENSNLPTRKKNRYPGFDYSHCGAYFITICAYKRITNSEEPLWQKSFYDSILDNEEKYWNAYNYIIDNPQNWIAGKDEYFVE